MIFTQEETKQAKDDYYSSSMARACQLNEGDIFSVLYKNEMLTLKLRGNLLYKVIKVNHDMKSPTGMILFKGYFTEWKETGKFYTPEELNDMLMKEVKKPSNE